MCFYHHSYVLWKTFWKVTHPKIVLTQTRLTVEFLLHTLLKRRSILLIYVVLINPYSPSNCIVSYLHNIRTSLIPMLFGCFMCPLPKSTSGVADCMCRTHQSWLAPLNVTSPPISTLFIIEPHYNGICLF